MARIPPVFGSGLSDRFGMAMRRPGQPRRPGIPPFQLPQTPGAQNRPTQAGGSGFPPGFTGWQSRADQPGGTTFGTSGGRTYQPQAQPQQSPTPTPIPDRPEPTGQPSGGAVPIGGGGRTYTPALQRTDEVISGAPINQLASPGQLLPAAGTVTPSPVSAQTQPLPAINPATGLPYGSGTVSAGAPGGASGTAITPADMSGVDATLYRGPTSEAGRLEEQEVIRRLRGDVSGNVLSAQAHSDTDAARRRSLALQRAREIALASGAEPGTAQFQAIMDRSMAEANAANLDQGNAVLALRRQEFEDALGRASDIEAGSEGRRLQDIQQMERYLSTIENPIARQQAENLWIAALQRGENPIAAIQSQLFDPTGQVNEQYRSAAAGAGYDNFVRQWANVGTNPETGVPWRSDQEKQAYIDKAWAAQQAAQVKPVTQAQQAAAIEAGKQALASAQNWSSVLGDANVQAYLQSLPNVASSSITNLSSFIADYPANSFTKIEGRPFKVLSLQRIGNDWAMNFTDQSGNQIQLIQNGGLNWYVIRNENGINNLYHYNPATGAIGGRR